MNTLDNMSRGLTPCHKEPSTSVAKKEAHAAPLYLSCTYRLVSNQ